MERISFVKKYLDLFGKCKKRNNQSLSFPEEPILQRNTCHWNAGKSAVALGCQARLWKVPLIFRRRENNAHSDLTTPWRHAALDAVLDGIL